MASSRSSTVESFHDTRSRATSLSSHTTVTTSDTAKNIHDTVNVEEPKRTQLSHTSRLIIEQRNVLESLDIEHREDLAKHLYITWLLVKRHNDKVLKVRDASRSIESGNQIQSTQNELEKSTESLKLDRSWRSWPLRPEVVPRFIGTKSQSSEVLSETLTAVLTRQASKRLRQRSQVQFKRHPKGSGTTTLDHGGCTVTTDDAMISKVAQPLVQEVLKKIDKLLIGLCHSRRGYASTNHYLKMSEPLDPEHGVASGSPDEPPDIPHRRIKRRRLRRVDKSAPIREQARLLTSGDIMDHAALQEWSRSALDAAGSRLAKIFPTIPSASFQNLLENIQRPRGRVSEWGGLTISPESQPISVDINGQFIPRSNPHGYDKSTIGVNSRTVTNWMLEDKKRDWEVMGGVISHDGFLDEVPGHAVHHNGLWYRTQKTREQMYETHSKARDESLQSVGM